MKTLELRTGDHMPAFGLGTWQSEPGVVGAAVTTALELGYEHVDCSPIYDNEPEIGAALSARFGGASSERERVWVTSKLWNNAHAPDRVRPALERTLSDLRLDTLDLYLIHWPVVIREDVIFPGSGNDMIPLDEIPLVDTWGAMESLVEAGLVRNIGVSNFSGPKVQAICEAASIQPSVNQVELHPYLQQNGLLETCRSLDVHLTAYSPLGSMARPERLKTDDEPVLLLDPTIAKVANKYGASPAQVAIAWAIQRGTSVIPKSVQSHRLAENLEAADLELDDDDMAWIADLDRHRRYISGEFWAQGDSPYTVEALWDE